MFAIKAAALAATTYAGMFAVLDAAFRLMRPVAVNAPGGLQAVLALL